MLNTTTLFSVPLCKTEVVLGLRAQGINHRIRNVSTHLPEEPGLLLRALPHHHLHRHILHLVPQPLVHLHTPAHPFRDSLFCSVT